VDAHEDVMAVSYISEDERHVLGGKGARFAPPRPGGAPNGSKHVRLELSVTRGQKGLGQPLRLRIRL
jgi:hypothetical protein